jgi:hypothetical protein
MTWLFFLVASPSKREFWALRSAEPGPFPGLSSRSDSIISSRSSAKFALPRGACHHQVGSQSKNLEKGTQFFSIKPAL